MNTERASYVVLDLETTGLEPKHDQILEVGAIAVDSNLRELDRFHELVRCELSTLDFDLVAPVVRDMHTQNGLWGLTSNAWLGSEAMVDRNLAEWLQKVAGPSVMLMGNSVHFDHAFIKERMPLSGKLLHYRVMDIGGLARWLRDWGYPVDSAANMPHRGMEDCEIELHHARRMRALVARI